MPASLLARRVLISVLLLLLLASPALGQRGSGLGNITSDAGFGNNMSDADYMQSRFDLFTAYPMWINGEFKQDQQNKRMVVARSESVSALDLQASGKALSEFEKGVQSFNHKNAKSAVEHFKKAVNAYPKFVSAYNDLGLAYSQLGKRDLAREQFQTAAKLDPHFALAQMNLGRLEMGEKNYAAAEGYYKQACSLMPRKADLLATLAFLQQANHEYSDAVGTAAKVHMMPHKDLAVVHYIAGAALVMQHQTEQAALQYEAFLSEDPANPLAPQARQILGQIAKYKSLVKQQGEQQAAESARLQQALQSLGQDDADCGDCATPAQPDPPEKVTHPAAGSAVGRDRAHPGAWVMRKWVDEVAMLFTVTDGSRLVNDLTLNDIQIRDNHAPPQRVLQFERQSKLPLRVGVLIDTSGSVEPRFAFEKQAATRFIRALLTSRDLAFVMGFATEATVTQDFTSNQKELARGLDQLSQGHDGTALWDAISDACWKLAAYPEQQEVARVLVVVTDGMDNASRTTLKKAILLADRAGITLYVVSTLVEPIGLQSLGQADLIMKTQDVLKTLAERTGGEAMFPGSARSLDGTFNRLRQVIRSRYLLAYKPANLAGNGGLHQVRIVAKWHGKNLKVHARSQYYAPGTPGE